MFSIRTGRAPATAPASSPCRVVDASGVVRAVGERIVQGLWPISAEVHLTSPLAPLEYPGDDLWRLMEILVGKALTAAPPPDLNPQALVGSRDDGRTAIFSVHSQAHGAFKDNGPCDELLDGPDYRTWEAKAIVERNGGRFWVDESPGDGSTAYFTVPH
jgi:hypothetical protein